MRTSEYLTQQELMRCVVDSGPIAGPAPGNVGAPKVGTGDGRAPCSLEGQSAGVGGDS